MEQYDVGTYKDIIKYRLDVAEEMIKTAEELIVAIREYIAEMI